MRQQMKFIITKIVECIFDFINHYIIVIIKKPITFLIIFRTKKVAQHVNVTCHTRR